LEEGVDCVVLEDIVTLVDAVAFLEAVAFAEPEDAEGAGVIVKTAVWTTDVGLRSGPRLTTVERLVESWTEGCEDWRGVRVRRKEARI
jgi:hypothetical protein